MFHFLLGDSGRRPLGCGRLCNGGTTITKVGRGKNIYDDELLLNAWSTHDGEVLFEIYADVTRAVC